MSCAHCQHPNADAARFCAQCGAPLDAAPASPLPGPATMAGPPLPAMAQPRPVPPSRPASGQRTISVVLGIALVLVLVFAGGIYFAVHVAAGKVRALAGGEATSSQPAQDASRAAGGTAAEHGTTQTGNVIGNLLGTDAKGKSDIGNALNNVVQAGARIEQHDKATGNANGAPDAADTQQAVGAAGGLLGALAGSLGGAYRHDPVDFHVLQAMLPTALPGMQRGTPRSGSNQAIGIRTTSADVDFHGPGDASINVSIKDATAVSGLAGLATMADAHESEQGDSYEKNENIDGRSAHETWDAPGRHGVLSLIVGKRFGVDIEGNNVDMSALKNALAQLDLNKLESMQDSNRQTQ